MRQGSIGNWHMPTVEFGRLVLASTALQAEEEKKKLADWQAQLKQPDKPLWFKTAQPGTKSRLKYRYCYFESKRKCLLRVIYYPNGLQVCLKQIAMAYGLLTHQNPSSSQILAMSRASFYISSGGTTILTYFTPQERNQEKAKERLHIVIQSVEWVECCRLIE